jgi:hypothetical protein
LTTSKRAMQQSSGSEPKRSCSARPAPLEPAFFMTAPAGLRRRPPRRVPICPRFGFSLLDVLLIGWCPHPVRGISRSL